MPKVYDTREHKARELRKLLTDGPSLKLFGEKLTADDAERRARGWLESWVVPLVNQLVPEFRGNPIAPHGR